MREHRVAAPDGRVLQVRESGELGGRPVLAHYGTPNSRVPFPGDVEVAERDGIRLITYDRPGYGGSDRLPGRSVADCAADVRAIADALGIARLPVWGISGGGPHAIACAALLPELAPAVAVLASPAPWGAEGLDYFAGMGEYNADDVRLYLEDREAARAKCEQDREETLAATPQALMELFASLLSPVDIAAATPEVAEWLDEVAHVGLAPSADGWWDDGVAMMEPWGFALEEIRTPVLLRHGREDRFVPFGHGEWLAAHIPGVQAELTDDDGHLTLTQRYLGQIHAWLLERT